MHNHNNTSSTKSKSTLRTRRCRQRSSGWCWQSSGGRQRGLARTAQRQVRVAASRQRSVRRAQRRRMVIGEEPEPTTRSSASEQREATTWSGGGWPGVPAAARGRSAWWVMTWARVGGWGQGWMPDRDKTGLGWISQVGTRAKTLETWRFTAYSV